MLEPRIWSRVSVGLPPDHPWAFTEVECCVCGKTLHTDNTNATVWVETGAGGYCLPDFTAAVTDDGELADGLARGKKPDLIEVLQETHLPVETEHGVCCFFCSQTASDSEYRVMYPCPTLQRAYDLEQTAPATGASRAL